MSARRRAPAPPEQGLVEGLTHEGEGVVRAGKTAFVAGSLPGESIRFQRVRSHRGHDEGRLLEVLVPSADRVQPRCAHFGVCGGCALQHLDADRQLEAKQAELRDTLERVGRTRPLEWLPPLTGPRWAYRRRARLGARFVTKKGRVVVGFRERLAPYIAAIDGCEVLAAPAGQLIMPLSQLIGALSIREHVPQVEVAVADNATALVLRLMVPPQPADLALLAEFEVRHGVRLYLQSGGVDTAVRLSAAADAQAAAGQGRTQDSGLQPPPDEDVGSTPGARPQAPRGEAPLHYRLPQFDVTLEFRPTDFIQVNGAVNAAMVSRVLELLAPDAGASVLDLFCGLGNFTLPLARRVARAVGIEGSAALVERARHNAAMNGIANVQFLAADLTQPLPARAPWMGAGFSHVVLDPPRAGAVEVLPTIAQLSPRKLVYISCHPGTLARDVGVLVHDHRYTLRAAGVLDMFPHTTHVESVAVLTPA